MSRQWRNLRGFLFFAGPSTFAFISITIVSFIGGVVLTFTNWNGLSNTLSFTGFDNYTAAIADDQFWSSLWLTGRYVVAVVLLSNAFAFAIAYMLSGRIRFRGMLRAGFFTPNLIGGVVLGFIWYFIFSQGLVAVGTALGVDLLSTSWLASETLAFWALVIATVWQMAGFLVIIYLAGLTALPGDVLEAASMDGAGGLRRLRSVVLPLMRPSFTICVFLAIGRSFMTYDMNLTLTGGGPYGSTELVAMHVYQKAFVSQQFGTGQTEALLLFVIVAAISVLQVSVGRRREVEL
ncbi:ABC transporter permease [Streptomyces canus]|uniref:ABC transporter permease n=1 Tax=Streptomyces canus TaxID=58343 RepID=A0A101RJX1_9ACTN|nr:sugar ABC transporter permease [Streptomyces canus]KUN53980.1 ABC transporter permease [Streptomyces canus]